MDDRVPPHADREALLAQVLDSALDGIMAFRSVRDDTGRIVDFEWLLSNDRACDIVSLPPEALIGKRLLEVMPGNKEDGLFDRYVEAVEEGGPPVAMEFYFDHHGIREWFQSKYVKLGDGFVVTFSVITDLKRKQHELEAYHRELERRVEREIARRRQNEDLLFQQHKLAAMGELLDMIAHQWRQPLNVVTMALGTVELMLDRDTGDPAMIRDKIRKAVDQIGTMSETIEDFRTFYRRGVDDDRPFDALAAIQHVVDVLQVQLRHLDIEVVVRNPSGSRHAVVGVENQFKQVLLAVVQNARDAIESTREGGGSGTGQIVITVRPAPEGLVVEVADSGAGIDEAAADRLFEPYFTTKHPRVGTGVGLYMVKTIVERRFGGHVSIRNGDNGAVVSMTFGQSHAATDTRDDDRRDGI